MNRKRGDGADTVEPQSGVQWFGGNADVTTCPVDEKGPTDGAIYMTMNRAIPWSTWSMFMQAAARVAMENKRLVWEERWGMQGLR